MMTGLSPGAAVKRDQPLSLREKQERARQFTHWHYRYDLGDGVITEPFAEDLQSWHDLRRRIIIPLILTQSRGTLAGKKCLDPACNSGFWSFELARQGAGEVLAFDESPYIIRQAEFVRECLNDPATFSGIEFRVQNLLRWEPPERQFDVVICLGLMYHLTDPLRAAQILAHCAKDLVIIDSLVTSREGFVLELGDPEKFVGCSPREFSFVPSCDMLIRLFRQAGLSTIERFMPPADTPGPVEPYLTGKRVLLIGRK